MCLIQKLTINTIILYCLLLPFPISTFGATIDTSFKYYTLETDHFSIHFHQGLKNIAIKTADIVEEIHPKLINLFLWTPKEKTQIVLIDNSDFTNGYASVLPYNTIFFQVVPPALNSTIGEYEDWLKTALIHEYTHIITIDIVRSYPKFFRNIFGKTLPGRDLLSPLLFLISSPPNIFLPGWQNEGIATWAETEFTTIGRGRSTFFEMIKRMAVNENNFPSIDMINGDIPDWPSGTSPYLFGMLLQKYLADQYGKPFLGKLNQSHAGRFPFFINGAFKKELAANYITSYKNMIVKIKKEEQKKINFLVDKKPITIFKTYQIDGQVLTNPIYSPDNKYIAFNRQDPHKHSSILIIDRNGNKLRNLVRRFPSDKRLTWSKEGDRLYFCQADVNGGFNIYQDLYSYNLNKNRLKRLTHGLRISSPALLQSNNRNKENTFAVVISSRGNQNLAILTIKEKNKKNFKKNYNLKLVTNYSLKGISNPTWSPNGEKIVYSLKDNKGNSGLRLYDVINNTDNLLFEEPFTIDYPVWSRDGKHIFFTSDETGIFNIYAYNLKNKTRYQVTHVLGGIIQPDISMDGNEFVFSSYNSKGFSISTMNNDPNKWMTEIGPSILPSWGKKKHTEDKIKNSKEILDSSFTIKKTHPYSPFKTILPHFWIPTLSFDHKGPVGGIYTASQDVLGYNTYTLEGKKSLKTNNTYFSGIYVSNHFYPTFTLQAFSLPILYSNLTTIDGNYYERNNSIILKTSIPIIHIESHYSFSLGYHLQKQKALSNLTNIKLKGENFFQGRRDNIQAGFRFINTIKYPYSISFEEGRRIELLYKLYSKNIGSDITSKEYIFSYSEYLKVPFTNFNSHHSIYFNFKAAISIGDKIAQDSFQLGGLPPPLSDFPLRGYPSRLFRGKYISTTTLEYRAPIKYIFKGRNTKPVFFDRLHAAIFTDAGGIWENSGEISSKNLKIGSGIELRMDLTLGYISRVTPTLGIAHGFNKGGESNIYFTVYFNL